MAKIRCTFTIDRDVMDNISKISKYLGTNKSAFIESILKETIESSSTLLGKEDTLASSVVLLTKKLEEVQSMISDGKFLDFQKNLKDAKNALL